jgi:hypothetical protein
MNKWEYIRLDVYRQFGSIHSVYSNGELIFKLEEKKNIRFDRTDYFAKLGKEGWELVSANTDDRDFGDSHYYFKRPLEQLN